MRLSREETDKIAWLARIFLKPAERTLFQKDLSQVIDFNAKKLREVAKHAGTRQEASDSLGEADLPRPSLSHEESLSNAPESTRGFFTVPQVLEDK